ncbi:uncharacterized protein [Montipora capricornis]|uniref:uncharacterized protein n=1 Tax=Montipora capricornis TaxID=246305 RepID=UPI0035F1F331
MSQGSWPKGFREGIPNAAFFFSAIATHERKKEPVNGQSDDDSDENDTAEEMKSQVRSQVDRLVGGNVENTEKVLHPAISYWIALTTPNGAPANPITVHRALLDCGVAVTANRVQIQEQNESMAMKELYKVFKGHRNEFLQDLVRASYQHCYDQATRTLFGAVDHLDSQEVRECGTENVVRVTLVNRNFEESLGTLVVRLMEARLQIDKFGFSTFVGEWISHDLVVSREPMQQSCGRRRKRGESESQGQAKKPRSTILNYFSSQRQ